jgi:hypothetical protein
MNFEIDLIVRLKFESDRASFSNLGMKRLWISYKKKIDWIEIFWRKVPHKMKITMYFHKNSYLTYYMGGYTRPPLKHRQYPVHFL